MVVLWYYIREMMSVVTFTLELAIGATFYGILFGLFLSLLRCIKSSQFLIQGLVSFLRAVPTILQLSFIYFFSARLGFRMDVLSAGIIGLGVASATYFAEDIRAGIESIPKGQFEAATTLNVPNFYVWKDVILPQVIVNISPVLINEIIGVFKSTALVGAIGGIDILKKGQMIANVRGDYYTPYCIASVFYAIIVLFLEYFERKLRKRLIM